MEGIYDAIMAAKGKIVTLHLASGLEFAGKIENMTYFEKGNKAKQKPRMIILVQGNVNYYYIDAIKVDAVSVAGGSLKD